MRRRLEGMRLSVMDEMHIPEALRSAGLTVRPSIIVAHAHRVRAMGCGEATGL